MSGLRPTDEETTVDGLVHYRRWPGRRGDRTLVCVHGLGEDHLGWSVVSPALADYGDVVELDLPGYGLTPRARRRLTVRSAQRFLHRFLDAVCPEPVVLLGSSFAGAVSVLEAMRAPQRVAALVLTSSYYPPSFGGWRAPLVVPRLLLQGMRLARAGHSRHRGALSPVDAAERITRVQVDRPTMQEHVSRHHHSASGHSRQAEIEAISSLIWWSLRTRRMRKLYGQVQCPTAIVHGNNDPQVPWQWAKAQHRRRPDWHLYPVEGEGHVAQLQDPADWLAAVTSFLRQLADGATAGRGATHG